MQSRYQKIVLEDASLSFLQYTLGPIRLSLRCCQCFLLNQQQSTLLIIIVLYSCKFYLFTLANYFSLTVDHHFLLFIVFKLMRLCSHHSDLLHTFLKRRKIKNIRLVDLLVTLTIFDVIGFF